MKRFFTLLFLAASWPALAQYVQDYKAEGDRAFVNKDYYEAAYYYLKAADGLKITKAVDLPYQSSSGKPQNGQKPGDQLYIKYKLADSYRLYENYLEAEPWYYQVLNDAQQTNYPLARLWYGICLRANQHFDEAIKQLEQFKNAYKGDASSLALAEKEIRNCLFAKEQYAFPASIDVKKLKGKWNSDGSNYATIKRDENYWFTSSRLIKNDKRHLNRIYHLANNNTAEPEIIRFQDEEGRKEIEYGTPSMDPAGKRLYFTRWYKEGSKIVHAIYCSERQGEAWSRPRKLNSNVNPEGFSAIQPFITADGRRMLFVSNKPGGQGANDLWICNLDEQGNPTNSLNLGPEINTAMDEQAPYYEENTHRLIYSSRGFTGLGGFDFFESFGDLGNWAAPRNMGYPMNSAKDDLYFCPNVSHDGRFFISSDRESDCCLELFEVTDKRYFVSGHLMDCSTQKVLTGATVSLVDSISKQTVKQLTLASDAPYSFRIDTKRPYKLLFEKSGYFTKSVPVDGNGKMMADTLYQPDACLQPFEVGKPIVIQNILYDYNMATLRQESKTVLDGIATILNDNPKLKIELGAHTDSVGSEEYNLQLSQKRAQSCVDYIISKGIPMDRIFARGYGEAKPIEPNSLPDGKDNADGRQLNRRTEFTVLKTDVVVLNGIKQ
ncbi:OmpA family protein [Mucilaginibacter sp. Bleaf8]|uniref:OmpA family protein n=1 Tax=Mucilaginibacter sp. Bleaf8 TaxID=2834430 RepID=UPI001BD11B20|nr:OmpA family protein [Mucilaginibacter sp. Bleaf8]MBS7563872.1 OmpA family protein [Mucilaginibacter sp. Bleaf8]